MKIKILFSLLMVTLVSCQSFLEPKSQSEFVPKNITSLNEMLLGSAYPTPSTLNLFAYSGILDDDITTTKMSFEKGVLNAEDYEPLRALYSWQPDMAVTLFNNDMLVNVWSGNYTMIKGCNAVLDYIDKVTGSIEDKNYVKAQALTLRAFYYFNLVNFYGEPYNYNKKALGVPLKLDSNVALTEMKRATVEEVYNQIIVDLTTAEELFGKVSERLLFAKNGRVTLPMVQLFLSRIYLYTEQWALSADYAKKVIEDWKLSLLDLNTFTSSNPKPYYSFTSYENPEALWLYGSPNDFAYYNVNSIQGKVVDPFFGDEVTINTLLFISSTPLISLYKSGDLRLNNYIVYENRDKLVRATYGKIPVSSAYVLIQGSEFGRALRLSEAYLNLAEANYMNKGVESYSVQLLNDIRKNRYKKGTLYEVPAENTSGEALLNFIKEERRREMCYEGHRWYDLRRWGMPSYQSEWYENGELMKTYKMDKNDPAYTLPIPEVVMEKNINLVQNKLTSPK